MLWAGGLNGIKLLYCYENSESPNEPAHLRSLIWNSRSIKKKKKKKGAETWQPYVRHMRTANIHLNLRIGVAWSGLCCLLEKKKHRSVRAVTTSH